MCVCMCVFVPYPPFSVGVRPKRVQSPTDMSRELSTVTTAARARPHLDFTMSILPTSQRERIFFFLIYTCTQGTSQDHYTHRKKKIRKHFHNKIYLFSYLTITSCGKVSYKNVVFPCLV
uniref:Secreted protein n=1 Tax=Denticeps clupeoides TaxID=299321 RepID=A0AAY4A3Q8_9TELE